MLEGCSCGDTTFRVYLCSQLTALDRELTAFDVSLENTGGKHLKFTVRLNATCSSHAGGSWDAGAASPGVRTGRLGVGVVMLVF